MFQVGIDVGSTTIKCVVLDEAKQIVYKSYHRHRALIKEKVNELVSYIGNEILKGEKACLALTGSASLGVAEQFDIPFVQEVVATQIAVEQYPETIDVVIELGGEDAKILFLTNGVEVRMNGTCAGGTGAFIDQMAVLLDVPVEEMDQLALNAERIYPIASRCGVFAKTDIQPLLNQGARKEDVAASIFHAVVNQTIGGLAQGRELKGKMMFLGGPLTFLKGLQKSFIDVLQLDSNTGVFLQNDRWNIHTTGGRTHTDYQTNANTDTCAAEYCRNDRVSVQSSQFRHGFHYCQEARVQEGTEQSSCRKTFTQHKKTKDKHNNVQNTNTDRQFQTEHFFKEQTDTGCTAADKVHRAYKQHNPQCQNKVTQYDKQKVA